MNRIIAISLLSLTLAGCGNLYEPKPQITLLKDDAVVSSTASISNTFILDRKTPFVTCSQGQPDAAFNQGEEGDVSFSLINFGGGSDSGAEAEKSEETEMVGRTPAVLLTRELFFRLCEFSRNYGLDKEEAKAFFQKTIDIVQATWSVEAGNTTVKIGDSLTTTDVSNILGTLPTMTGFKPAEAKAPKPPASVAEFCTQNPDAEGCDH